MNVIIKTRAYNDGTKETGIVLGMVFKRFEIAEDALLILEGKPDTCPDYKDSYHIETLVLVQ